MAVKKSKVEATIKEMHAENVTTESNLKDEATVPKKQIPEKDYDNLLFEDLEGIRSNYGGKVAGSGCLTIINHPRDGVRLHVAYEIWRDLGFPKYMRPVLVDGDLLIFAGIDTNVAVKFNRTMDFDDAVANYKSKVVLYASKTAKRLVAEWGLEQYEGCSFTGGKYSIRTIKGQLAAVIVFEHDVQSEETSVVDVEE